jgi:hypothetical protein
MRRKIRDSRVRNNFRKKIRNMKGSGRSRKSRFGTGNINARKGSRCNW